MRKHNDDYRHLKEIGKVMEFGPPYQYDAQKREHRPDGWAEDQEQRENYEEGENTRPRCGSR
jgi:hypothetical protein